MMKHYGFGPKHRHVVAALLLVSLALVVGCGGETAPLTEESLKSATYQGIGVYPEAVKLTDGKFEGPYVESGSSRSMVIFVEPCAFGDLNGDGVDDAAVFLAENAAGSGVFVYLAAVLNQRGKPENVATTLLGDRAQVEEMAIESGQISVTMLTHKPGDPMCCPSDKVQATYVLEGDKLVLQGG